MTEAIDTSPTTADAAAPMRRVSFAMRKGEMAGIAFGDARAPVDVLFLHAAGFNALSYRNLLAPLGQRLHVVAVDLRGHGRTSLPAGTFGYSSWGRHRKDVIELLETHFNRRPVALAGHSLGATVSLLAAGKRPELVSALTLVDPVILSPAVHGAWRLLGAPALARQLMPIARSAGRRRSSFPDQSTAVSALKRRGIFAAMSADTLVDYSEDGLLPGADGALHLACRREYEAATYAAQRHDPWEALRNAPLGISVLRAEKGSTIAKGLAKRFARLRPDARIAVVEGSTHALPWERPDRVRAAIEMAMLMAKPKGRFADLDQI